MVYLPLWFALVIGIGAVCGATLLIAHGILPWLVSPIALLCWGFMCNEFLSYEQWRASGCRGRFVNPGNITGGSMLLGWYFFGLPLFLVHVLLRNRTVRRLRNTFSNDS